MSEDVLGLHGFKVAVWQPDSSEPKVDLFAVFFFGGGARHGDVVCARYLA